MLNLFKKDLILQRYYSLMYLAYIIGFLWIGWGVDHIIVMCSALFVVQSHYFDEKDGSNILLNSLPYTRKEIVASKYIGALLFTAIVIPVCLIGDYFIGGKMEFHYSFTDLVLNIIVVMVVISLYLPFFYKFKTQYLVFAFTLLTVGIMFLMKNMPYFLNKYATDFLAFLAKVSDWQLYSVLALIAVGFYGVSWLLSYHIYRNKAF
ncbi:ABC-2 transporter permease [Bacillus massiliigorillae]|uniref:ABC-2 transporter permease n=1 Tax=Bacillus massiliigorillae TaxID=1243664 RepID=UPI00039B7219|nr:ABC-2 transporter permease [Bacillus massiliigorillae]